ncbi:trypsin-like serine peptidase [Serratia liquefaciens]|uniref:trypsin-like serine peptidase n=1 Tax=Serratia liquefaciens TaxID=614 RepID=UPI0037FB8C1B
MSEKHSFMVTEDNPLLADLKLSWASPVFSSDDGIGSMRSLHEAGDSLVAVAYFDNDGLSFLGSGVMIAPGLLLTATHVLDELQALGKHPIFLTFLPIGARGWLAKESRNSMRESKFEEGEANPSDLTLVSCTLNSDALADYPLNLWTLRVGLPLVGERLWAFGFRHGLVEDGVASVSPMVSSGLVTAAFPQGRGERMPAPCIEVEMDTMGGMSGGPVVDSDGNVIGVVSSSFDGGPSYVTLIWDALNYRIGGTVPALMKYQDVSLLTAKALGLSRIKGSIERKPWGDIVFTMSEDEMELIKLSSDPSAVTTSNKFLKDDQLEEFIDKWGCDLEDAASEAAIKCLESESGSRIQRFLGAIGIPLECLKTIRSFSATDFEGVEDPEIYSSEQLNNENIKLGYYFELLSVIWGIQITEEDYHAHEMDFDKHFYNQELKDGMVHMEAFQRCLFKADVIFNSEKKEVADIKIVWMGIRMPKDRVKNNTE